MRVSCTRPDIWGQGTSLRVNDIFNDCMTRGRWSNRPNGAKACIVFVTPAHDVRRNRMGRHRKKHTGIHMDGTIGQCANDDGMVSTLSPQAWKLRFVGLDGAGTRLQFGVL